MKKLFIFALLSCQYISAQAVVFLEINDTLQKPKYQEFIYLNDATDISQSVRVGTLKSIGSLDNPVLLYNMIKTAAQKVGANSFKLVKFDKYPDQTGELTLETFYTNDSILGINFKNIEKNKAYVFGNQNMIDSKTQNFKVNGKKYTITSGHYMVFNVLPGENLEISKGGFGGTIMTVEGKMGKPSKFYSLAGFEITGGEGSTDHVGVNFSTGDVNHIEQNLALLLLKMFEEQH